MNSTLAIYLTSVRLHLAFMFGDSSFVVTSGGGEKFMDFMEKELIPYVENNYPVTSYRTFVGHSFGGLAAVYSLLSRPQIFSNYVAIDPSLWWDDWIMVNWADSLFTDQNLKGKNLYIGVANTMEEGMDIQNAQTDTTLGTAHIRSILQFAHSMENKTTNELDFNWKYYNDDDHGSVPLIAEYDGLRYLFRWHNFKGLNQIINSASEMTAEERELFTLWVNLGAQYR